MNVLALVTDAYGGRGGIALYNRNVLAALCRHPDGAAVTALARVAPYAVGGLPAGLSFSVGGDSKLRFTASALRAAVQGRGVDLVVCGHLNLLPVAEAVRRISGAPLMLFVYGLDAWSRRSRLLTPLLRQVDAMVSIRKYTLDLMGRWADMDGVPSYVLENAIHLENYGTGAKPEHLVERYQLAGKRVLMTLGRTDDPNFGFDEIIEVMPALASQVPNVVYVIAGSGKDLQRLEDKARARTKPGQVVFTGEVSEQEKADHYRLADAFAMPGTAKGVPGTADFDTYPLRFTFLEAMACGLPVVGTRPEDPVELAQSPVPLTYVDAKDPASLLQGLVSALRRGPGPVPPELDRYAFPNFCSRLHAIVDETLTRRRADAAQRLHARGELRSP